MAEGGGHQARHLVARRDQAEDAAIPGGALANGVDEGIAGQAAVIHRHPAAGAELQAAAAGQGVLRPDAGGKQDQVGLEEILAGEVHAVAVLAAGGDVLGSLGQMHAHAQVLDTLLERGATEIVQLHRHQPWGEFHHMGFQAQRLQGIGRL